MFGRTFKETINENRLLQSLYNTETKLPTAETNAVSIQQLSSDIVRYINHSQIPLIVDNFVQTHQDFAFVNQLKNHAINSSASVFVQNIFSDILKRWSKNGLLNDQDESVFRQTTDLLSTLVSTNVSLVILDKTFIKRIRSCIKDIAEQYTKYLNDINVKNLSVQLKILFKIPNSTNLFSHSVTKCVSSKCYVNVFKYLKLEKMRPS
ncbi:unnamed protein product, partial [Didymodactylos carnosus]